MSKTLYDSNGTPILTDVSTLALEQYLYSVIKPTEQQARINGNDQSTIFIDGKPSYTIQNNKQA